MPNTLYIDAELEPLLQIFPEIELSLETIQTVRKNNAMMIAAMKAQQPVIRGVVAADKHIPGPAGDPDVHIRIYEPEDRTPVLPALLWIHGGGYVMGSVEEDDFRPRQLVKEVGCVLVAVDYRLAPEHPYPAPLEDCYAALKWMFDHADEIGVDAKRIGIGGGSAGGGLAAGLTLLARDRGEVPVVIQILIYPMIDDCNIAPAGHDLPDTLIWSRHSNLFGWTSYLNGRAGEEDIPAYAAAMRAVDLRNLPPTFIAVGDIDLFSEEDMIYARRLIQAGIPTELHVYPGAFHGFEVFAPDAAVSRRCDNERNAALKQAFSLF